MWVLVAILSDIFFNILPARSCACAGISYGPVSVCVCHRLSGTNQAGFGTGASFDIYYTVL